MKQACILLVFLSSCLTLVAQQSDTAKAKAPAPQWGIDVHYGLLSYTESGLISAGIVHTRSKHAFALSTHIWHHDLFTHPDNWARLGAAFTYSFLPIGSNRMFSPYLFYDLNYGFHAVRREVFITTADGEVYGAVRDAENHTLAHHFGVGVRANVHRNCYLHLGLGAGPASYGNVVTIESRSSIHPDQRITEHPFTHFEPVYMLRIGVVYQLDVKTWKKSGTAFQ